MIFFNTSDESELLIARKMELTVIVIPSSNSMMADVLYRLGTTMTEIRIEIWVRWCTYEPYEVAIMGEGAIETVKQMQRVYLSTIVFMVGTIENLPLLENKLVKNETIIYVCRNKVCKAPWIKLMSKSIYHEKNSNSKLYFDSSVSQFMH